MAESSAPATAGPPPVPGVSTAPKPSTAFFQKAIKAMVDKKGSDMLLKVGRKPTLRVAGELEQVEELQPLRISAHRDDASSRASHDPASGADGPLVIRSFPIDRQQSGCRDGHPCRTATRPLVMVAGRHLPACCHDPRQPSSSHG